MKSTACCGGETFPSAMLTAPTNELPFVPTADWSYLRLRQPAYKAADLEAWLTRISDAGWRDAYVFFKHEDEAAGPAMAADFINMAAR